MIDRDCLSDGASQRDSDDVHGVEFEHVEQTDGVRSHIRQGVGRGREVTGQRRAHIRCRRVVEVRRAPGVAIVEANHLQSATQQCGEKAVRPLDQLRRPTHDQQHDRIGRVATTLIGDLDARRPDVGGNLFVQRHELAMIRISWLNKQS